MKAFKQTTRFLKIIGLLIGSLLVFNSGYAQIEIEKRSKLIKPEVEIPGDVFWHVKAFRPEAALVKIKAIDKNGKQYDIKGIQTSESTSVLNVKAIINENRFAVKVLPKGSDPYYPVKVILEDGSLMDVKAIIEDGSIMDVKGVSRSGNIINLMAVSADGETYNIISISPLGNVNVVKGLKMLDTPIEAEINGVKVFAHVKAIKQN